MPAQKTFCVAAYIAPLEFNAELAVDRVSGGELVTSARSETWSAMAQSKPVVEGKAKLKLQFTTLGMKRGKLTRRQRCIYTVSVSLLSLCIPAFLAFSLLLCSYLVELHFTRCLQEMIITFFTRNKDFFIVYQLLHYYAHIVVSL